MTKTSPNQKRLLVSIALVSAAAVILCAAVYAVLASERGSAFVIRRAAAFLNGRDTLRWEKIEGSLVRGIRFDQLRWQNLRWFEEPNELTVQSLAIDLDWLSLKGVKASIQNAKLSLPKEEPILIFGSTTGGNLDLNLFTSVLSIESIRRLIQDQEGLQGVSGRLEEVDIFIKGPYKEFKITGGFHIRRIARSAFWLEKAPCRLDLKIKQTARDPEIYGSVTITEGRMGGNRTALIRLKDSRFIFSGPPANPKLDVKASAVVETMPIHVTLTGDAQKPNLKLTSEPPMSQERLLLSLATNRTWNKTADLLKEGQVSPELAKDFLGYLILGQGGNRLAERAGVDSLSVQYGDDTKGLTATKSLTDRLEGSYGIRQKGEEEVSQITHEIGGEYRLTDSLSVEAKKEIKPQGQTDALEKPAQTDDQVLLKFRKSF